MPRIRTIKPEFWSDEKLSMLSAIDRLVFLGLIGMADDFGRLHDNIKVIDAFVFPNSSETVRESVENLSRIGRIRRGKSSNGASIIEIANWSKHQRVDKPQTATALPAIHCETNKNAGETIIPESFANGSRKAPETFAPGSGIRDQGSGILDQGAGAGSHANALPRDLPEWVVEPWQRFMNHIFAKTGQHLTFASHDSVLMEVLRRGPEKGLRDIEFSIQKNCKTLRDSDNDYEKRGGGGSGSGTERKTRGQQALEAMGL